MTDNSPVRKAGPTPAVCAIAAVVVSDDGQRRHVAAGRQRLIRLADTPDA